MKRKRGQEEQNTSPKIENINTIFLPQLQYTAYSQSFIHHTTGLSGINIMTSSQLACQLSCQSAALVSHRSWVQIPYKGPEFFSGLIFFTARVVFITAKIAFIFTYLSAVQICEFHIFTVIYSSLHGFIWNQHNVPSSQSACQLSHLFTTLRVYMEST